MTRVPISNRPGVIAIIDTEDWKAWLAAGRSATWFLNSNGQGGSYVRYRRNGVAGDIASVARDLLEPGRGRVVRFKDGQPLNLTRANLELRGGYAPGVTTDTDVGIEEAA